MLWIAFKKLYLWYSEQQKSNWQPIHVSCELLSKNCIFDILNNNMTKIYKWWFVVNCFQKIVSLIFWTTTRAFYKRIGQLWIAFKKLYLWYSEQLGGWYVNDKSSCELLSKNCIFDILNNIKLLPSLIVSVVNCFQKIVSLIFWTTNYSKHDNSIRCELLSKNCIFDILNNPTLFI